jgi:RHS repeat-associated protein
VQQYEAAASAYDLAYDAADQLKAATHRTTDPTPAVLRRYAYGYDLAGNRITKQDGDSPAASTYNNLNHLLSQDGGGALTFKGMVNEQAIVTVQGKAIAVASDNRFDGSSEVTLGTNTIAVVATDPSGNARTNTYQVSVASGPSTFGYDANGSLTSNGTKAYEWDGQNRLARVLDSDTEVAHFAYDGFGRRAQKFAGGAIRTYVYGGEDILEERLSTGGTTRYVHGPGIDGPLASIDSGGTVSYYLADHLGSIVQATSSSAAVTLTRRYDAYGNLLSGSLPGGYAFTGREWDTETNLYYYRARYYDPTIGRFLSRDRHRSLQALSVYAYVRNNPVRFVDPLGLCEEEPSPKPPACIIYRITICKGCGCTTYWIPSEACDPDVNEAQSPRWTRIWWCSGPDDPTVFSPDEDPDWFQREQSPPTEPGNGPRVTDPETPDIMPLEPDTPTKGPLQ